MSVDFKYGIDAGHQALASSLLVAGSAIDLSGEIEIFDEFGLQSEGELSGWEEIVLDSIARFKDACMFKAGDRMKSLELDIEREGGREAIKIVGLSVPALGFDKKLVTRLVGETDDFILDRGAIAGAVAVDTAGIERRMVEASAKDVVGMEVGIGEEARFLML